MKVKRVLARRLGGKEDRIFVFQTQEVSRDPAEDDEESPQPNEQMKVEIVIGRQNAVDRLANYLTEFGPPAPESTAKKTRKSKGAVVAPPPPKRDWRPLGDFANTESGERQAQELRLRALKQWKAQKLSREQREDDGQ
jgi:hypothetical protein